MEESGNQWKSQSRDNLVVWGGLSVHLFFTSERSIQMKEYMVNNTVKC